jgi:hypothetical protein
LLRYQTVTLKLERQAMHITEDDAAFIYARACRAWYGRRAKHVVNNRIKELQRERDEAGVRIWNRVADHLTRLSKRSPPTALLL